MDRTPRLWVQFPVGVMSTEPSLVLAEPIKTGSTLCNTVYVHNKQEKKGPAPGAPKIGGASKPGSGSEHIVLKCCHCQSGSTVHLYAVSCK